LDDDYVFAAVGRVQDGEEDWAVVVLEAGSNDSVEG